MRHVRQLHSSLLGAVVLVAVLLGAAGPASAHDALESNSPAAGAALPAPPEQVALTFNQSPLALGSQILVNDAAGVNWAEGRVAVTDNVAAQKLKSGAPAGQYTVQWRMASSDGHPIEGSFSFTATAAAGGATAAAASTPGGTTAAAGVPTMGTAQPGTTSAPAPVPDASQPFPWSVVIFVAVAVGILAALGVMAKRRLTPGADSDAGSNSGAGDS